MVETVIDEVVLARLKSRFPRLDPYIVERCLREVRACAEHLDIHLTEKHVESLAVAHLTAIDQGRIAWPRPDRQWSPR